MNANMELRENKKTKIVFQIWNPNSRGILINELIIILQLKCEEFSSLNQYQRMWSKSLSIHANFPQKLYLVFLEWAQIKQDVSICWKSFKSVILVMPRWYPCYTSRGTPWREIISSERSHRNSSDFAHSRTRWNSFSTQTNFLQCAASTWTNWLNKRTNEKAWNSNCHGSILNWSLMNYDINSEVLKRILYFFEEKSWHLLYAKSHDVLQTEFVLRPFQEQDWG